MLLSIRRSHPTRVSHLSQSSAFSSLQLLPALHDNLASLGYESMTPVQCKSLPPILAGHDVIAQAETGSGKTVAFGLGILSRLEPKRFRVQAMVLCPTRELADQVAEEIRKLARSLSNVKVITLCGGVPVRLQATSLGKGVHIVVGTPGRVEDHLKRETLDLSHVQTLVLDEADRMLQMGFEESLDAIMSFVPVARQSLLLSATFPEEIERIANRILSNPTMIVVEPSINKQGIDQQFFQVNNNEQRIEALRLLLLKHQPTSSLVFCSTRQDVRDVTAWLDEFGFSVLMLHGEMEQRERDQTLVRFANGSATVLVATDVAARGLDIDALDVVVNYQLSRNIEDHVHRVGRTGRAGVSGTAWSFYDASDAGKIEQIQDSLGIRIANSTLPAKSTLKRHAAKALMQTIQIDGGKKQKLRPGDILGALTGDNGIQGSDVGKIKIVSNRSYVAVRREALKAALKKLGSDKLKGRSYRVRVL